MSELTVIQQKIEFKKIQSLFLLHMFVFMATKFLILFKHDFSLRSLFFVISWGIYYRFFNRMLKFLHYSFWTMLTISALDQFYNMAVSLTRYGNMPLFYLTTISLLLLMLVAGALYSPLYYPIFNWWEYDFRYRNDVIASIDFNEQKEEVRLIDIRKSAGGMHCFQDLEIGTQLKIYPEVDDHIEVLSAEVITKKPGIIGRPIIYGLMFHFETSEEKENFKKFQDYWDNERLSKQKEKFKK